MNATQSPQRKKTAAVLLIGDELLSGRTHDENLSWIATRLNEVGVQVAEARVVPDISEKIADALNQLRAAHDYVFTTGGIGPTHDDITADSVAAAFGVGISHHPEAVRRLEARYADSKHEINESRLRMARIPDGGVLVGDPRGDLGFRMDNVFVLAGVPRIMRVMLESAIPLLEGGDTVLSRTIRILLGEGDIAAPLKDIQSRYADVGIGSYPFYTDGAYGTRVVLRSAAADRLSAATEEVSAMVSGLGAEPVEETADSSDSGDSGNSGGPSS